MDNKLTDGQPVRQPVNTTMRLRISGSGYEYVEEERGGTPVYIHRLCAVAEYGFEAVRDKDVHHLEIFDGRSESWANGRDLVVPENRWEHRCKHLGVTPSSQVPVAAD